MNTIKTAAASIIGSRHARAARNGQDAVAVWRGSTDGLVARSADRAAGQDRRGHDRCGGERPGVPFGAERAAAVAGPAAVVVVCDGCSSGESSEVGARLGANLFARAVGVRLEAGESPCDPMLWAEARAEVVAQLGALADQMLVGCRVLELGEMTLAEVVREHFLFTVVAAAVRGDEAAVWAVGDGVYSFGDYTRQLGPYADNAPPYLAYDLLGDARPAHFEIVGGLGGRGLPIDTIIIGTDGAADIIGGVERFATRRFVDHPDALRRELAVLAKPHERIDWDQRRVLRTPAVLQDDCAVAVLRWEPEHAATAESLVSVEATS